MILQLLIIAWHLELPTIVDFSKVISTHMPTICKTMLWKKLPLKKSLATNIILLLRRLVNDMWVPSMASQILDMPIISQKQAIILCDISPHKIWMCLINNLSLSHKISQTMSMCFLTLNAPMLNYSTMCVALVPWVN